MPMYYHLKEVPLFIPALFTSEEGGAWKTWPPTCAPPISFYSRRAVWPSTAILIGFDDYRICLQVHSLLTPAGARWDCINGWTGFSDSRNLQTIDVMFEKWLLSAGK
jgi:hypothetical protein